MCLNWADKAGFHLWTGRFGEANGLSLAPGAKLHWRISPETTIRNTPRIDRGQRNVLDQQPHEERRIRDETLARFSVYLPAVEGWP